MWLLVPVEAVVRPVTPRVSGPVIVRAARWLVPVAAASLAIAPVAHAQVRTVSPVATQRPMVQQIVLLPDGAYQLTLTPAWLEQRAVQNAQPIVLDAQVTHSGGNVTVTTADGMSLKGSASASHLKASGAVQASTLTLELGGSGTTASGTFKLVGHNAHELAGTAVVSPAPRMVAHTSKSGCHGFWDCVKTITGFDWSVFGG